MPLPNGSVPFPIPSVLRTRLGVGTAAIPAIPYWEPCLSYQRSWGPGACGGGH
jgi:hypothetical protein